MTLLHIPLTAKRDRVLGAHGHGFSKADFGRQIGKRAMQVPGGVTMAVPFGRNDFEHVANGRRVHGLQKCNIVFAKWHGGSLFLVRLCSTLIQKAASHVISCRAMGLLLRSIDLRRVAGKFHRAKWAPWNCAAISFSFTPNA